MNEYNHSVYLDIEKCIGCTTCIKHCPTEAIRVRNKHAVIDSGRCIDCGECIRVCPSKAKKPVYAKLSAIKDFKYRVALPAPSLFGQFEGLDDVDTVLTALKAIGFDDVYEVSQAAEFVTAYTRLYLKTEGVQKPVISSACPVVVRLINLRFPSLRDNIMPILPPMELAAMNAIRKAKAKHPDLKDEDIGIIFISPCPAKVSYITNGFAGYESKIDLVVSINDVYFAILNVLKTAGKDPEPLTQSGNIGFGWATTGGEASAIMNERYLAADGIDNVIHVLELMENGSIPPLDFIELNACQGGCVGGVMTVENPFVAKARLQTLKHYLPVSRNHISKDEDFIPPELFFNDLPSYHPISRLSNNIGESMKMMVQIQKLKETLPGIDCGACGSPSCRAFAEDIVKGEAKESDCPIKYRDRINETIDKKPEEV